MKWIMREADDFIADNIDIDVELYLMAWYTVSVVLRDNGYYCNSVGHMIQFQHHKN